MLFHHMLVLFEWVAIICVNKNRAAEMYILFVSNESKSFFCFFILTESKSI